MSFNDLITLEDDKKKAAEMEKNMEPPTAKETKNESSEEQQDKVEDQALAAKVPCWVNPISERGDNAVGPFDARCIHSG